MPDHAKLFVACIEDADYKSEKIEFWNNVYGFDFSCIKEIAYREPLVDVVEGQAINTNSCEILNLDLNTCRTEDLTFKAPFELWGQKRDYVHAIVAWFDITFEACHKPVYFSTSPYSKYTHWKQTVFYLKDALPINGAPSASMIKGWIDVKPNEKNVRDLDIQIQVDFEDDRSSHHVTYDYVLR